MQSAAARPIASSMGSGASLQRIPESWEKNAQKGILIPAWCRTPAEAKSIMNHTSRRSPRAAASMTMDLLTKPLNSGKAEMEAAPTMQNVQVHGMDRYRPPTSVALIFPVWCSTAPMDMNSSALYRMWLNAWDTVPFRDSSVPIPMPTIMKPTWLIRL